MGAGCVEQVAQTGAAMALKQRRARPGLTEAEALHSPGEAAHQGQPSHTAADGPSRTTSPRVLAIAARMRVMCLRSGLASAHSWDGT